MGDDEAVGTRVRDTRHCEMYQAHVAAGVGIGFLPRLALHPVHPGVVIKPVAEALSRRILAIALPGAHTGASEVFLRLLEEYATAYPTLKGPARA